MSNAYEAIISLHLSVNAAADATSGGKDFTSGLVRARPFAIPIQAFCVGDACRSLHVQATQDLLHRTLDPGHS